MSDKAYFKEYRRKNKERILRYQKKYYSRNKQRCRAASKKWRDNNLEKARKAEKVRRDRNRDRVRAQFRAQKRKAATGFTQEMFDSRLHDQGYKCAICKVDLKSVKPVADHNHKTKQCRSALCSNCNVMIGYAKERPEVLRSAAEYLEFWSLL